MRLRSLIAVLLAAALMGFVCPAFAENETDLASALTFHSQDGAITISGTAGTGQAVVPGSRIQLLVVNPEFDITKNLTETEMEQAIRFADSRVGLVNDLNKPAPFSFTFRITDQMPFGVYQIIITVTAPGGTVSKAEFSYKNTDPDIIRQCTEAFRTVSQEQFAAVLRKYSEETDTLNLSSVPEISGKEDSFGAAFVLARSAGEAGLLDKAPQQIATLDDVYACLKAAVVFDAAAKKDKKALISTIDKYGMLMPAIFGEMTNADKAAEVIGKLTLPADSAEKFCTQLQKGIYLSVIWNGTYADVSNMLSRHADVLGVDTEAIRKLNVTFDEIAPYVDTKSIDNYLDGMGDYILSIAEEIAKNKGNSDDNSGGSSGGSSGGGGSGGGSGSKNGGTYNRPITDNSKDPVEPDTPPVDNRPEFGDLDSVPWAQEAIYDLAEQGIVAGVDSKSFEPNRQITREEFVKLITCAFKLPAGTADMAFSDCAPSDWFYPYVAAAFSSGLINGISDAEFGTGRNITRQDMVVICLKLLEMNEKLPTVTEELQFADSEAVSEYALAAVQSLSMIGIVGGYDDGRFGPQDGTTRAQAAVVLSRLMNYIEQ